MGYDGKYGKVTTEYGDIPDDELVMVIRARDAASRGTIAHYLKMCEQFKSPIRHLRIVAETLARFIRWQEEHPERVRVPDSERSREWLPD